MSTPDQRVSMDERLRTDYGWTPRQRQVLDLLAGGRSNPEIADRLGISRDGVKYHIGEVLSKLGVDSREEAAEYWRRHQGLGPRFARVFRSVGSGAMLRWGAAALAVGGVALATVVILASRGDDRETSDGTEPAPSVTNTPVSPTASVDPTSAAVLIPGLGVAPSQLTVAQAQTLPERWTLFAWHVPCYQCDGSFADFRRWTNSGGSLTQEFLFSFTQPPSAGSQDPPGVYSVAFASDPRRIAAALCTNGYCGGLGQPSDDAEAQLFRSDDGGDTWQNIGALPHGAFVSGFLRDEVVLRQVVQAGGPRIEFTNLEGKSLAPSGLQPDAVVLADGRNAVWVTYGRTGAAAGDRNHLRSSYQDADGPVAPPSSGTDAILHGLTGTDGYVWELHTQDLRGQFARILAVADRNGVVRQAFRWDGRFASLRHLAGGRYFAGYGDDPSLGTGPVPFVIDLSTGTLTPLSGFPRDSAETYTYPMAVLVSP